MIATLPPSFGVLPAIGQPYTQIISPVKQVNFLLA